MLDCLYVFDIFVRIFSRQWKDKQEEGGWVHVEQNLFYWLKFLVLLFDLLLYYLWEQQI